MDDSPQRRIDSILSAARNEAARCHHDFVGTEHILLAVIADRGSIAAKILETLGVDSDDLKTTLEAKMKPGGSNAPARDSSFTIRASTVLQLAIAEAPNGRQANADSEHILIGLICEGNGIAATLLRSVGVTAEAVRDTIPRFCLRVQVGEVDRVSSAGPVGGNSAIPALQLPRSAKSDEAGLRISRVILPAPSRVYEAADANSSIVATTAAGEVVHLVAP